MSSWENPLKADMGQLPLGVGEEVSAHFLPPSRSLRIQIVPVCLLPMKYERKQEQGDGKSNKKETIHETIINYTPWPVLLVASVAFCKSKKLQTLARISNCLWGINPWHQAAAWIGSLWIYLPSNFSKQILTLLSSLQSTPDFQKCHFLTATSFSDI